MKYKFQFLIIFIIILVSALYLNMRITPITSEFFQDYFINNQTYPPIYITINAHGHNYGIQAETTNFEQQKEKIYTKHKNEIIWLAQMAEDFDAKMNYQLNGEYIRDARLANDLDHLIKIHNKGHHVGGVHYHRYNLKDNTEFWEPFNSTDDESKSESTYNNHVGEVNKALASFGSKVIRVDSAVGGIDDNNEYHSDNISILPSGESFSYTKWNIKPWNPFRRKEGTVTTEDLSVYPVSVASIGQVGKSAPSGLHSVYAKVSQLKRHFLMLLAEWREHERNGEQPKIWSFGIMTHPDQNENHHDHMIELLTFFKSFSDMKTSNGNQIVKFVTDKELVEIYKEWEENYPGESSFTFNWESHRKWEAEEVGSVSEEYPYKLKGITEGLFGAELVEEINNYKGVVIYKFNHSDMQLGPMNENYQRGLAVCKLDEEAIYLAWSDTGSDVTIDFRKQLRRKLYLKSAIEGKIWSSRPGKLRITPLPMLISSTKRFWEEESNCWCEQNPSDESCSHIFSTEILPKLPSK